MYLKKKNYGEKYREAVSREFPEDVYKLSADEVERFDRIFVFVLDITNIGYPNKEAEMALRLAQRQDVTELRLLEYLLFKYDMEKNNTNTKKEKLDEVFSIILDYDILLKIKDVEGGRHYSPIDEMTQAIKKGTFGKDNKLSKEEFAFSMRMLQNPKILDDDTNQKLREILRTADMNLEIGKREMLYLLENTEVFEQITEGLSALKTNILKQIHIYIYSILKEISNKQREITLQERMICSRYFKNYFEKSVENNFTTQEFTQLFFLIFDLANPNVVFNIRKINNQQETTKFFENEFVGNQMWEKFDAKLVEEIKKIKMNQNIGIEEFQIYDKMFLEYSYRVVIDDVDNIEIIRVLNEQAKKLKIPSRTLENEIEKYIYDCMNNEGEYNNQDFYEIILDYYERQLEGSAVEINNNTAISHLIRAAQIGRLHGNTTTRILEKLEERKQKNPILQITETEDLETYMNNVAEIRLQQGRMPMEACEFIIKQAILNLNGMNKHFGMIQRAFEDFTEYQLKKSGLTNYFVAVQEQPFLEKKTYAGLQDYFRKIIMISKLKLSSMGAYRILETVLHEHTHAEDDEQIENGQLNGIKYRMLKEYIIEEHRPSFYDDNYQYMFCEINARIKGYMKRIKVLRGWGLTDEQIAKLQKDDIQTKVKEYCEECREGKTKKLGDVSKDVNAMFFELLQENEGILDEYPALQMEFEVKGEKIQRKSFVNMLQEFEHLLSQTESQKEVARISNLYSEILLNGGEIEEERKKDEIEQLIAFKSENPIIMAYRDRVIKVKFTRQMAMAATMKNFYEKTSAEERKKVCSDGNAQIINSSQNNIRTGENNGNKGENDGQTFEM